MSATFKIALAALAISAFASTGAPAAFADKPGQVSFRVSYADLNLSAPAGARKLLGRIEQAATRVCDDAHPRSPLFLRKAIACRNEAITRAVNTLGFDTLTAAWNGKYAATVLAAR